MPRSTDALNTRPIFLDYDTSVDYGSREHYFHFLWGYLLPALHWWMTEAPNKASEILILTCGPSMDPITDEASSLIGMPVKIVEAAPPEARRVVVPRWDGILYRHAAVKGPFPDLRTRLRFLKKVVKTAHHVSGLPRPGELQRLKGHCQALRAKLVAASLEIAPPDPALRGRVLVLRRSPMPEYYADRGGAEIKGYGASRRSLSGIDEAIEAVGDAGLQAAAFEPGGASLAGQISTFSQAAGIVGIRGAEFGNLIWMEEGRRALMLSPRYMRLNHSPAPLLLARVAGVDLVDSEIAEEAGAPLDPDLVLKTFSGGMPAR